MQSLPREALAVRRAQLERCERALIAASSAGAVARGFVPGRIEVLGKHVDYAGGRSVLCTVDRGIVFAAAPRAERAVCAIDVGREESRWVAFGGEPNASADWSTYIAAVARRLARDFPDTRFGCTVAFSSDLPPDAGLSSSSALVIATYLALVGCDAAAKAAATAGLGPVPVRGLDSQGALAEYLAAVENGRPWGDFAGDAGVGTLGGSQDHTALLCCKPDTLSRFAFCPARHLADHTFPAGLTFVVGVSGVHAAKAGAARDLYNRASLGAAEAARLWRAATGDAAARTLADVLRATSGDPAPVRAVLRESDTTNFAPSELLQRFDQFVVESVLHDRAAAALDARDWQAFAAAAAESHRAAEELLGNQVPETRALVRLAHDAGAIAASAFGAGFGGSVWALLATDAAADFMGRWRSRYANAFPSAAGAAAFFATRPSRAAHYVTHESELQA
ncbi:MAG: galactokinase family protein [Gemmatimonadaceae bacterium]